MIGIDEALITLYAKCALIIIVAAWYNAKLSISVFYRCTGLW